MKPQICEMRAARSGHALPASAKILAGLQCMALAFAVLATAARWQGAAAKMSPVWLLLAYLFLTLGELFIIPLTQSLMTQLKPASRAGLASGGWFAVLAAGYCLAGTLGAYWKTVSHAAFFAAFVLFISLVSLVVWWRPPSS